jgi:hypothetical protein
VSISTLKRPIAILVSGAHAIPLDGPRVQRMRSTVRSVSHVFESGAANTAVVAFGWRGAVVVPVVVGTSMILAALHGRRIARVPAVSLLPRKRTGQRRGLLRFLRRG